MNNSEKITSPDVRYWRLWLVLIPVCVALIYVLPPLYVYLAYPAPPGAEYSQIALGQLYNYDEYGFYLPEADRIAHGRPPLMDITTYEGRNVSVLAPSFVPFTFMALVETIVRNKEMVMPAMDVIFSFVVFFTVCFFMLKFIPSKKAALLAATLTMLPPPLFRIFITLYYMPREQIPKYVFLPFDFPMMSRTFSPQMTFPLLLVFLVLLHGIVNGDKRARVIAGAGVLLGVSVYVYFFATMIAAVIIFKAILTAINERRKDLISPLVWMLLIGAAISLPYMFNYYQYLRLESYADIERETGIAPFNRFAPANLSSLAFFAGLYAVYFTPALKRAALYFAIALVPVAMVLAFTGAAGEYIYFITPALILLVSASFRRGTLPALMFIVMASCMEMPLAARYLTGKTHADVYYFYRMFFLQFVPILIVAAAWVVYRDRLGRKTASDAQRLKGRARAGVAVAVAIIIVSGAVGNVSLARDFHKNYFVDSAWLGAIDWLGKNAPPDSVVLSFDAYANTYLLLKTRCYLYLPKAGLASNSLEQKAERMAMASKLLGVDTDKLEWSKWDGWGYYLFQFWTATPESRQLLQKEMRIPCARRIGKYRLNYVFYGPEEKRVASINPETIPGLKKVFENRSAAIYSYDSHRR